MTRWGASVGWSQSGTGGLTNTLRVVGGTSPDVDNMVLNEVTLRFAVNIAGTRTLRCAVYSGGALDNPVGASLVEDLGVFTISGAMANYVIEALGSSAIPRNVPLWIAVKVLDGGNIDIPIRTDSTGSGDLQTARGRAALTGQTGGNDATVAFPATLDGSATFGAFWYGWYLDYGIAITGPTVTTQPADETAIVGESPAFTFSAMAGDGDLITQVEERTSTGPDVWESVTGATSSPFSLGAVSLEDSGRVFRVKFSDDLGETYSDTFTLTVLSGPAIAPTAGLTELTGELAATLSSDFANELRSPSFVEVIANSRGTIKREWAKVTPA